MALHEVPQDGTDHTHTPECACEPEVHRRRRPNGTLGTVYVHQDRRPDDADLEADCGHIVIEVGGEFQHHEIPDDGAPHAPTTECGCGPQREDRAGHVVYAHTDQDLNGDAVVDDGWEGGAQ